MIDPEAGDREFGRSMNLQTGDHALGIFGQDDRSLPSFIRRTLEPIGRRREVNETGLTSNVQPPFAAQPGPVRSSVFVVAPSAAGLPAVTDQGDSIASLGRAVSA